MGCENKKGMGSMSFDFFFQGKPMISFIFLMVSGRAFYMDVAKHVYLEK